MRKVRLQTLVVLAVGAGLGYLAANGASSASREMHGAASEQSTTKTEFVVEAGTAKTPCCEVNPAVLLAQAETQKKCGEPYNGDPRSREEAKYRVHHGR